MPINQTQIWVLVLMLTVGTFFSALIPPFQSPDEFDHIKRAYLFSNGVIILDAPQENMSGGMIDSGLLAYFNVYNSLPFNPEKKWSAPEAKAAQNISWTGKQEFSAAPGTGFYCPVIYTPHAIALGVGEQLGLSNHHSYLFARFLVLISASVILIAAFRIYPVSPLTIALLIIPMSIFQFSSATIDGISTALAALSMALFLSISRDKKNTSPSIFYLLTFCVTLLVTSRLYILPLVLLIFFACFYLKKPKYFFVFGLALFFIFTWIAIVITTTVDTRVAIGASSLTIVLFYFKDPLALFDVLAATFSNISLIKFYAGSFFGVLGWLDVYFEEGTYLFFFLLTLLIALFSISIKNWKIEWLPRLIIFLSASASIFLAFFALLVTWTPHPAEQIQGIQGRYFLIPMLMISYALCGSIKFDEGIKRKIAIILLILLGLFSIFSTTQLLIERYYLALG